MTDPQPLSPEEEAALRQALSESNGPETVAARLFATLAAARAASVAPDLRAAAEDALAAATTAAYGVTTDAGHDLVAHHAAGLASGWDVDTFSEAVARIELAARATSAAPELRAALAGYVRGHWDGLHCDADTGFGILDECEHVGRIYLRAALAAIDDLPGLDSPGGYVGEMVGREAAKNAIRAALAAPEASQPSRDALDVERLARAIRTAELQTQMDAERLGAVPAEPGPLPDWYRAYAADVAAEYTRLTAAEESR